MNKLLLVAVSLVVASSLHAGMSFGLSSTQFGDTDSEVGFTLGVDSTFYEPESIAGVGIGLYFDVDYYGMEDVKSIDESINAGTNVDAGLLVNYTFNQKIFPVEAYAGVGYGGGLLGSNLSYDGLNYQAGATFNINERHGVGVRYKHNDMELSVGDIDDGLDIISLYWRYEK
jgi:hypothetical protein